MSKSAAPRSTAPVKHPASSRSSAASRSTKEIVDAAKAKRQQDGAKGRAHGRSQDGAQQNQPQHATQNLSDDKAPRRGGYRAHTGAGQASAAKPAHAAAKAKRLQQERNNRVRVIDDDLLQKPWVNAESALNSKEKLSAHEKLSAQEKLDAGLLKQLKQQEGKIHGENSCRVTFSRRPQDVIRLYLAEDVAPRFADVMKYLAQHKRAYHLVSHAELEKIAGSQHHGGVVMIVKRKDEVSIATYLRLHRHKTQDCLLALDGVGNPHNLGAIARSCAHFGSSAIVMTEPQLLQSGAAARTAEGGVEFIQPLQCDSLTQALQLCRQAGYTVITTSSHAGVSLYKSNLPAKVVIVFGEEMQGVSAAVAKSADIALQIPGTGHVESLNVSVAASLILGEWYRQQQ